MKCCTGCSRASICRTSGKSCRKSHQLRRAVRRVLFHVRQGEPAQSARERHLSAGGFDDAARRLRALFYAAAGRKRAQRHRAKLRQHLRPTGSEQDDPVKAERANYFDAGISQKIGKHVQVGLDGYYKNATHQLDDGLFGQTLILSAFNYAKGGSMAWN